MNRFKTKKEVFDFFEEQISRAYYKLYADKKLESESYLLKSYLLEVDVPGSVERLDFLRRLFSFPYKDKVKESEIYVIEPDFFEIIVIYKEERVSIYIEWISDRFIFVYTLAKSTIVDSLMYHIIHSHPQIDHFWLWDDFLDSQIKKPNRYFKGFSFDYDYRSIAGNEKEEVLSYLKMQLWGGGGKLEEIYSQLRSMLNQMAILGRIRFKEFGEEQEEFTITDIKFNGKVRSHGTSIGIHRKTLVNLKQEYESKLKQLEKYRFKWSSENLLEGEPFYFVFEKPLPDEVITGLLESIFSGKMPFRLLGIISQTDENEYIVHVVDLHIGEKFILQVFPDMMLAYLSDQVCSNTILRFYTNLQHTLNMEVKLENDSAEKIL